MKGQSAARHETAHSEVFQPGLFIHELPVEIREIVEKAGTILHVHLSIRTPVLLRHQIRDGMDRFLADQCPEHHRPGFVTLADGKDVQSVSSILRALWTGPGLTKAASMRRSSP